MTRTILFGAALLAWPTHGLAQDTVIVNAGRSSSRVAREAVGFFNAPSTTRVFGRLTVGPDDRYPGDIGVLDGPVRISGVIDGDLVAINATVHLLRGAEIHGDVLVLGGTLASSGDATVDGTVRLYRRGLEVRRLRDRLELVGDREPREPPRYVGRMRSPRFERARASIVLSTAGTYNRFEGLPILIGPEITWGGDVGGRIRALGVIRTAGDFDTNREDMGYAVDASFRVGSSRNPTVRLGVRAYDLVRPVEDWQLDDDEIGLAAFFLHRDYRDYYLQRGYSGYLTIEPARGLTLTGEIARDDETSIATRDPWTLFRRDDRWRANPRIDTGIWLHFRGALQWDTRYNRRRSASGWLLRAEWERGRVEDDFVPRPLPLEVRDPPSFTSYQYDRVFLDVRRYERLGWSGELRLRAVGAGAIGDTPLPVQRRLSLGGPDPLPGYAFRRFACNGALADPSSPALCDRIVLFQAEYRGSLFFGLFDGVFDGRRDGRDAGDRRRDRWLDPWDWHDWFWWDGPELVVFADAGTGWLRGDDPGDLEFDVGAGLSFGSFGVYGVKALAEGEPLRLLIRMHHRF